MLNWIDVRIKEEQYKDLLREAEKRALIQEALMERKRRAPFAWRMLAALARHLADLRCTWLEWYASVLKVSVQTPCQEAGTQDSW